MTAWIAIGVVWFLGCGLVALWGYRKWKETKTQAERIQRIAAGMRRKRLGRARLRAVGGDDDSAA